MSLSPQLEQFTPLLGSSFMAHTQAGLIELQLSEAEELARHNRPAQFRTPLSLILTGPPEMVLQQGTYVVEHATLGQHQWFMAPILAPLAVLGTEAGKRCYYQILFA